MVSVVVSIVMSSQTGRGFLSAWRSCDEGPGIELITPEKNPAQHGAGFFSPLLGNDYIAGFFAVGGSIPFSLR